MARIKITDEMVQAFFDGATTDPGETINARETRYGLQAIVPLIEAQLDQGTPCTGYTAEDLGNVIQSSYAEGFKAAANQALTNAATSLKAEIEAEPPMDEGRERTSALHIAAITHHEMIGSGPETRQEEVERSAVRNLRFIRTGSFDEPEDNRG